MAGMRLSRNFTLEELLESYEGRRRTEIWDIQNDPPEWVVENLRELCQQTLQPLRELMDWPIHVNSGWRCRALNELVGGSANSAHIAGLAADVVLVPGFLERHPEAVQLRLEDAVGRERTSELLDTGSVSADFILFATVVHYQEELCVRQVIHEWGAGPLSPAWVHVARGEPHRVSMIGDWTDEKWHHVPWQEFRISQLL